MGYSEQYDIEYKPKETFLQTPPAKKVRYDPSYDLKNIAVLFTCGNCYAFFNTYAILLEHLYWRHGTEGKNCPKCPVRKWDFAAHKCFEIPPTPNIINFNNDEKDLKTEINNDEQCRSFNNEKEELANATKINAKMNKKQRKNKTGSSHKKKVAICTKNTTEQQKITHRPTKTKLNIITTQSKSENLLKKVLTVAHSNKTLLSNITKNELSEGIANARIDTDELLKDDLYVSDSEDEECEDLKVTALQISQLPQTERESEYCFCGKNDEGASMIGCDNEKCKYQWFHYYCVGIETAPEGNWYCPQCS